MDARRSEATDDAVTLVTDTSSLDTAEADVNPSNTDDVGPEAAAAEATLLPADSEEGDAFGISVALSADGTRALIGAPRDDTAVDGSGSARVFVRTGTGWVEEGTLRAADGAYGDEFGSSLAINADGTRAFIGAPRDDTPAGVNAGSVRAFVRGATGWTEEATLLGLTGESDDLFGYSVATSADGTAVVVGAPHDDTATTSNSGIAHVFVRAGAEWTEAATLVASDAEHNDLFGSSVCSSADGARVLVGAPGDDLRTGSGRVFMRVGTTWTFEATLMAYDGARDERLGDAVSLSADGSRALVAAPQDRRGGVPTGSVYVFSRRGAIWTSEGPLLAFDGRSNDRFGQAVALSGDGSRALVGAPRDNTLVGDHAGTARLFVHMGTGWTEAATILAPDGADDDALGSSVSLSADGTRALIGVPGFFGGTARVFTLE